MGGRANEEMSPLGGRCVAMTDEPVPTLRRIATLTAAGLFLLTVVPAISVAPDVPQVAPAAAAQVNPPDINCGDTCDPPSTNPCDHVPTTPCPPSTNPCDYVDCTKEPCDFVNCPELYCVDKPCPGVPCVTESCPPVPPVPDACNYANLCLYGDTFLAEFQGWDPQVDGVPHPTLDCATGPTIPWVDTDGDGTLDPVDEDRDCDHISDDLEYELGLEPLNRDSDDDGVVDTRDLTPTTNVPVSAVVRAVEFALLNWDTGPSDAQAPDDPFLRNDAGITNNDGDPMGTELLSVGMMTETDHLHQNKVYDYTTEPEKSRDDTVEFSQDISDYSLTPCLDCYPKLEFHFPIHDHDDPCDLFGEVCASGHPKYHEEDAENERYVYKKLGWTLLRLSAASSEAWSIDKLRDASLSGHNITIPYGHGDGWAIDFTIKRATNTSPCGVINSLLGSLEGSGSDDYVTITEFQNEETDTGYNCPKV